MKGNRIKIVFIYFGAILFLASVVTAFILVNHNAHLKSQAMVTNDMKVAVQPAPDSGLVMCQQMSESPRAATQKLSHDQVNARFEFSQYADIKDAGLKLVGTVERVDAAMNNGDPDLSTSMGAVMALRIAWEDMQGACANHGINLPDMPS